MDAGYQTANSGFIPYQMAHALPPLIQCNRQRSDFITIHFFFFSFLFYWCLNQESISKMNERINGGGRSIGRLTWFLFFHHVVKLEPSAIRSHSSIGRLWLLPVPSIVADVVLSSMLSYYYSFLRPWLWNPHRNGKEGTALELHWNCTGTALELHWNCPVS